jgi:hypothetical protein
MMRAGDELLHIGWGRGGGRRFWPRWSAWVPWPALCGLIEPFYPKPGNGCPPVGVEPMLRI